MYHLVYGILYIFSLLPLGILYIFSDIFFLIVYYVTGYRRDVVRKNLALAFPEKSDEERKQIEKRFFRNLIDTIFETIKLLSAGNEFLLKHVKGDLSLIESYQDKGKKVQLHLGHHFNWELSNLYGGLKLRNRFLGVYMPMASPVAEKLFRKLRTRTGTILIPATNMLRSMLPFRKDVYLLALIADQTPANPAHAYWVNFFGRPTAFIRGPEKGARAGNVPVFFGYFSKISRGHYAFNSQLAAETPSSLQEGVLTARYAAFLEKTIRQDPAQWLWSHRRWKHEWKPEYGSPYSNDLNN